jgi:hypothetical protein
VVKLACPSMSCTSRSDPPTIVALIFAQQVADWATRESREKGRSHG